MADRIKTEIDAIDKSIGTLVGRIQTLKKELESGNWGTQQLSDFEAKLDKLNQTLSRKVGKRETLVSKQDTQELDRLNKSIDTTAKRLKQLRDIDATQRAKPKPDADFEFINKQIEKYDRALSSLESRRAKRFDPISGKRLTEEQLNLKQAPIPTPSADDVQKRINLQVLGVNATNAEIEAQTEKAIQQRLEMIRGGVPAGKVGNTISTPAGPAPSPNVTLDPNNPYTAIINQTASQINAGKTSTKAAEDKARADAKRARQAAEAAAKEKELNDLRIRFDTEAVYKNAKAQAEARGFGSQDLQRIIDRGGGIQNLKFAKREQGVEQQFTPYVNTRTGASTPGLSSQFRTFGSDILRDIGQFTKWSIAIAAVYTPMKKLGELITIMVDNESRLADAAIAANIPFEKSGELFDTVAVSANQAGEGINTTIDAYAQAIRAAGRYTEESEKQVATIKLLNDSLILSKLSTLDQAESIDTLSAALLQSDRSLTQGQELLNKWVKVSQIANVTIDGLATGVAVLGDSAETVGVDIDHLNGLIAVLSEQSISGAKEAANTAKALVGAYQSDKSEAALNKYGIALRKANGEVKGFLEIYQELATLRKQGILSETAVSEVALAIGGGGVRRAKDASALISSTDRLNDIARESAKITGEDSLANDALAKKLETVQTANTRLANSFQELAQTLGDSGGLLDVFKGMINGLTGMTKATDELFTLLGRSGPILAAVTAGLIAMQAASSGTKATLLAQLGATPGSIFGGKNQFGAGIGYGKGLLADVLQMNYRGAGVVGGLGVAAQGASNIQAGRNENAIANVAGGAIGAAIGASLGGPIGLAAGANVGSAMADAFVNAVNEHSKDLADYFIPKTTTTAQAQEERDKKKTYRGKSTEELIDTAYNSLGFFGKLQSFFAASVGPGFSAYGGKKESAGLATLKTENPELYKELNRQFQKQLALERASQLAEPPVGGAYEKQRKLLEEQATQARQAQLGRLATGQITTAEYGRITNQISGFPATSIKSVTAFGDEITKVSKDIQTTTDAYDAFLYIAENGTQEQINLISSYSDDILKIKGILETWSPALIDSTMTFSFGDVKVTSKEQFKKLLADLQKQGSTALGVTLGQVQAQETQKIKLPPLVGDYTKAPSRKDYETSVQEGTRIQQQFYEESGKTVEEVAKLKAGIETWYTAVDSGGRVVFQATSGLEQRFYELGKSAAEAAGKLEDINQPIGFQKYDVPISTLNNLAQQSLQIGQGWQQKFNYDYKPEDQIAIDNQGIVQPLHADFKILALLLEKLNEKAQKQLDGQYNIPEGATFWVPLTAAYYRNKEAGAGGAGDLLAGLDLNENTGATDANTQALRELTAKYQSDNHLVREYGYGGGPTNTKQQQYEQTLREYKNQSNKITTPYSQLYLHTLRENQSAAEKLPGGTPTFNQTGMSQLLTELRNILRGLFTPQTPGRNVTGGYAAGSAGGGYKGPANTAVNTTPTTKLDLRLSSNVNLLVDGRVLASTLQSYLASELLRTESSQGTITKRYVI